jgi:hypothetical protein
MNAQRVSTTLAKDRTERGEFFGRWSRRIVGPAASRVLVGRYGGRLVRWGHRTRLTTKAQFS